MTPEKQDQQPVPPVHNTHEARSITGPVAEMMQQQDTRILAIEQMCTQLNEAQTKQHNHTEQKFKHIHDRMDQHEKTTQNNFDQVVREHQDLHKNIADALNQQESRMARSFDELKQLFMQRGVKRAAAKKPDEDEELLEETE